MQKSCLLLLLLQLTTSVAGDTCKWTNSRTQDSFDLNPLAKPNEDYQVRVQGYIFYLNLCKSLTTPICGIGAAACQTWDGGKHHALIAMFNSMTFSEIIVEGQHTGLLATFSGGDESRKLQLNLICDPNESNGSPTFLKESPLHNYVFEWRTKYSCIRTSTGLSLGSSLLITFFSLTFVYLVGGIIFKRVVLKAEGWDMIPQRAFWADLPGLVFQGILYLRSKMFPQRAIYEQL